MPLGAHVDEVPQLAQQHAGEARRHLAAAGLAQRDGDRRDHLRRAGAHGSAAMHMMAGYNYGMAAQHVEALLGSGGSHGTVAATAELGLAPPHRDESPDQDRDQDQDQDQAQAAANDDADRFVRTLVRSPSLMRDYIDALLRGAAGDSQAVTEMLQRAGYFTDGPAINQAMTNFQLDSLEAWVGVYPTTVLIGDAPRRGPTLVIDRDGSVQFGGQRIVAPRFVQATLSWRGGPLAATIEFGNAVDGNARVLANLCQGELHQDGRDTTIEIRGATAELPVHAQLVFPARS
ncbi:MAG TPA: hypothetical protein VK034_17570 [Enhygromyxa sp.]|nr:hypothetical protein [Enhygromyxa sp.]